MLILYVAGFFLTVWTSGGYANNHRCPSAIMRSRLAKNHHFYPLPGAPRGGSKIAKFDDFAIILTWYGGIVKKVLIRKFTIF